MGERRVERGGDVLRGLDGLGEQPDSEGARRDRIASMQPESWHTRADVMRREIER